ncbi:NUDIX hydrolase domain-like protein [Amanita rubescens]|nr:NUDIX hydrolase domain-like protein [Amanita rubescens]
MPLITHPSLADRLISRSTFLGHSASIGTPFDKLVVGVAITHPLVSATKPLQILVVQRAAHEKVYPGFYELPGGNVEDSDKTILDAAVREAAEETGLIVSNIVGEIQPFEYSIEKILAAEEGAIPTAIVRTTIQLNFVAQVTLNPEEHQKYAWVSKEDLGEYKMTPAMTGVVTDALVWTEQNFAMFNGDVVTRKVE